MVHCPNCSHQLEAARLRCTACGLSYEGSFAVPRLARLSTEQQQLVEQIVLAGANLKEVARLVDVSYPTLRKRLDALIAALGELRKTDETRAQSLLDEVEAGRLSPETAARLIKEMSGGA